MPKLDKQKFFYIGTDTFKTDIAIFINYTPKEALKIKGKKYSELRKLLARSYDDIHPDEFEMDSVLGRMLPLERGYALFLKFYKNSFRKNLSLASHEISHVVSWLLLDRRISLTKETDEVYAYLTEQLIEQFLFKLY
jgi:hypothetical protein